MILPYKKERSGSRLSYIHNYFANALLSTNKFHDEVNNSYYKYFSQSYNNRETKIISKYGSRLLEPIKSKRFNGVYDIGSGKGFVHSLIKSYDINFSLFHSCDPYQEPDDISNKNNNHIN